MASGRPVLTGFAIAADAKRYVGKGYVYGGNASTSGDWDCSSFVSYVLGHDLQLDLPGGRWGGPGMPPSSHGPVVTSYAQWPGASTVPGPPQAGDLCCFVGSGPNGHIGIAVSASQMVSALNHIQGTVQTPIQGYGPPGAPLIYRRVSGTVTAGVAKAAGVKPGGGAASVVRELAVVGLAAWAMVVAGFLVVAVAPAVVGFGAGWLIRRVRA